MSELIKVLVADDHPIFRHGLCALIQSENELSLIGSAENGQIALEMIAETQPDIVILDLDMPVLDGVATARILQKIYPTIKVVFLTMHKDRELFNMLKPLNIKGYVLKDSAVVEIIDCIKRVKADKIYISPSVAETLLGELEIDNQKQNISTLISLLTATEKRVLRLVCESKTTREIASELFVSIRTIENHRFNICAKLKIKGNHSLIKFALSHKSAILGYIPK